MRATRQIPLEPGHRGLSTMFKTLRAWCRKNDGEEGDYRHRISSAGRRRSNQEQLAAGQTPVPVKSRTRRLKTYELDE